MSRVVVLKGGPSLERQVSLRSGARIEDALERLGHEVHPIDVGADLVARLREISPDAAFVAMHGRDGEDGTVQELLEILEIPYTGSGVLACARCIDKVLTKHLLIDAGIPTPEFFAFNETAFRELGAAETLPEIGDRLGFPTVVKPAGQGSALGIKFASSAEELPAAIVAAFSYDTKVLLERRIQGRELAVSIVDSDDGPEALPIVEARSASGEFYDFGSRYEFGQASFKCPAELDAPVADLVRGVALDCYRLLGCEGFGRIDLILEESTGTPFVLEANAIPGLTETSLLPQAADAGGVSLEALTERILEGAFRKANVPSART